MKEDAIIIIESAKESMEEAMHHLEREFQKIRTGKAAPEMLYGILVEYYGTQTPIEQTSNINTPDPRLIVVQPFDKSSIKEIEKAIIHANIGFNPQNDGELIRINVPPLTEERRKELVKKAKSETEDTKVSIRNTRRQANDEIKSLEKDGMPEDESKRAQDEIQKLTDDYIKKLDGLLERKEKDILTV